MPPVAGASVAGVCQAVAMASTSLRRRRPLLYLLIAGFVVGVVWLTRAAWRPARGRGTVSPLRDVSATPAASTAATAAAVPVAIPPDPTLIPRPNIALAAEPTPQSNGIVPAPPATDPAPPSTSGGAELIDPFAPPATPATHTAPDDLTRIEGIGRRMAAALVAEGISTFQALGVASPAQLRQALANQGLRFAPSLSTWPEQAQLLADGDQAGFAEVTARLRRGGASA